MQKNWGGGVQIAGNDGAAKILGAFDQKVWV